MMSIELMYSKNKTKKCPTSIYGSESLAVCLLIPMSKHRVDSVIILFHDGTKKLDSPNELSEESAWWELKTPNVIQYF